MITKAFRPGVLAAAALLLAAPYAAQALPVRLATTHADALASLKLATSGALTSNQLTNSAYNAVQAKNGSLLMRDDATLDASSRAMNFLAVYGALSGVSDPLTQLQTGRISQDSAGNTHVHMDQMQNGLPVFGARLVVHMNGTGITGVNGVFVPGLESLSATPAQDLGLLRSRALVAAAKLHPGAKNLAIESSRLMYYATGLLQGIPGSNRLAYEAIVSAPGAAVRERIILDANRGTLLNRINEIHSLLNRKIYTPVLINPVTMTEATPVYTEKSLGTPADPPFVGDTKGNPASSRTHGPGTVPLDNLYIYAGGTWQMYKNLFGRDGYDFCDGTGKCRPPAEQVQKSVYLANDQCPNAYWDGTSTNYCPGFDADDVVSHEWSHAYTEYTAGLVYQYQSGALNESYSDIFGETYDLIDGFEGPLGASLTEGDYYENMGSRWVVGEDLSQAAAAVLLRDMWDPDAFPTPSPGSAITSDNYYCSTGDNGGVHTNSGVSNHAYAMLVDGKTFNGVTVPGIGLIKAAHIYFQAHSNYETPTTNFPMHADGLEHACADLIGKPINDFFGKVSTEVISAADCQAVSQVILAVEFRGKPGSMPATVAEKCNYKPVLLPEAKTPALCASGTYVTPSFAENFEAAATLPTGWTQGKNVTGDTDIDPWTTSTDLPKPHTGRAAFFKNNLGGTCAAGGDQSASHYLDTPAITVATAKDFYTFTHFMQSESGFDGGNLKYSLNGGAFAIVPAAAFTYNGHSGVFGDAPLAPGVPDPVGVAGNNTSPNAGEVAWTGSDQGEATGSWGTTIVDLSKLTTAAKAGDKVKFRYDFANDGCGGNLGWYIEDVKEFSCAATPPPNVAPAAKLTASPTSGAAALNVSFGVSGTDSDIGDKVVSYTLDFGDGTKASDVAYNGATTVTHSYGQANNYTATLTVKDSYGLASAAVSQAIKVLPAGSGSSSSSSSGGSTSSGSSGAGPIGPITPGIPGTTTTSRATGRFGGGAFGLFALLPLAAVALRRRRRG